MTGARALATMRRVRHRLQPPRDARSDDGPSRSAREDAARLLSARALTEAELRSRLLERRHADAEVEDAIAAAREARWLDDRALARAVLSAGSARLGRGRERLLRELETRGVASEVARLAWDELVASGEIEPEAVLAEAVARRVRREGGEGGRLDRRAAARVYNALFRAGHDPEGIRTALEPHLAGGSAGAPGDPDDLA